jgi:hypothetical protein
MGNYLSSIFTGIASLAKGLGITFSYLGLLMRSPENWTRLAAGLARWFLTR